MPFDWIPLALLALLVVLVLLTLWLALRRPDDGPLKVLRADVQQLERSLRDEVARSAGNTRSELAQTLATFQQTLLTQQGDVARTQNEQIDSFRTQ
ncbi:MAG: DNA recombination protein RmuC, partial [Pseudomonadota bacterium]